MLAFFHSFAHNSESNICDVGFYVSKRGQPDRQEMEPNQAFEAIQRNKKLLQTLVMGKVLRIENEV